MDTGVLFLPTRHHPYPTRAPRQGLEEPQSISQGIFTCQFSAPDGKSQPAKPDPNTQGCSSKEGSAGGCLTKRTPTINPKASGNLPTRPVCLPFICPMCR